MTGPGGRFEAAIGADRAQWKLADTWTWVDLTPDTQDSVATITRGRAGNQQQVMPASLPMLLGNPDGDLTPRHPGSIYYPNLVKGTPVRFSVAAGDPYLRCDGSGVPLQANDHATFDITGDLALAVCVEAPLRFHPVTPPSSAGYSESSSTHPIAKWNPTGNQRSYRLPVVSIDGDVQLRWSIDGTTTGVRFAEFKVPKPASGPFSVALELDVNNGLGGYTVRCYTWRGDIDALLANLGDALHDEVVTTAGTTSVFSSSAPLCVGATSGSTLARYAGGIIEARVINGSLAAGTEVANPDMRAAAIGASSFVDAAGRTWTVGSAGEITNERPRYFGELADSRPVWPGASAPGTAQVRWNTSGVLRRMRQHDKPLDSPMRRTVGSPVNVPNVYAYWPMDEGSQAKSAESPTPGVGAMTTTGLSFGGDASVPGSDPAPTCSEQGFGWNATVPIPAVIPTSWRLEMFAKIDPDGGPNYLNLWRTTGTIRRVDLLVSTSNYQLNFRNSDGAVVHSITVGWDSRFFDQWMYWTIKLEQSGGNILADFNVVPLTGDPAIVGIAFGASDTVVGTIGRVSGMTNMDTAPAGGLSVANFTVVSGGLSVGWLANADTGWRGESATQRIARLCREQGVLMYVDGPVGVLLTGIDEGVAAMGAQGSKPLLELLEECAAADFGYLGEDYATGGLTYRTGATLVNQEPVLTLTSEVTRGLAPVDDDKEMVNDLTVSQPDGTRRRYVDQESVDSQGLYDQKLTLNLEHAADLYPQAGFRVAQALWPEMRYGTIPVALGKNEALWPGWMRARPGDLLVATSLPSTHPSPEIRQLIDGFTETISAVEWSLKVNTSPEGPWAAGVLGGPGAPDTDARSLDTAGAELASSATAGATSLSVATTEGPLWTTDAAEFPLDLDVGGERCTATACSGASSPQTFTVVRGVDGMSKAHPAGTPVRVWFPILTTI